MHIYSLIEIVFSDRRERCNYLRVFWNIEHSSLTIPLEL
jgi:hypothetical protein